MEQATEAARNMKTEEEIKKELDSCVRLYKTFFDVMKSSTKKDAEARIQTLKWVLGEV